MRFVLRLVGFILIVIGILVILYALWSSYELFTGKKPAPVIFSVPQQQNTKTDSGGIGLGSISTDIIVKELTKGLITATPNEYPSIMFNMLSWSVSAFIMIFGGSQLAKIGIGLLSSA
ncbi:MAG: hypothetical protein V1905_02780 [bacterium]